MKAIVTGGCGFIGSHLVTRLLAGGTELVYVVDDLSTGNRLNLSHLYPHLDAGRLKLRVADCANSYLMRKLVQEVDIVYHLAAVVGVDEVMRDPGATIRKMHDATASVLAACEQAQKRLIITSSSEVYGRSEAVPFREDADLQIGPPDNPRWCYAAAKLMDEFMAMASHRKTGLPVTIVRLFNTIGPRQSPAYGMVVPKFIEAAKAGKPLEIHGDGCQTRCFSSVHDVVRCLMLLSPYENQLYGQVYNVGSTEEVAILSLAAMVIAEVRTVKGPEAKQSRAAPAAERIGDMRRRLPDVTKLKSAVGYVPATPLAMTLAELAKEG